MTSHSPLFEKNSETQGVLRIGPVARFTAERFGARLRRTLMREVEGAVVCAVRIEGASHEFSLLDGVVEDGVQIVENLKKVRVGLEGIGRRLVEIEVEGPGKVTAGDLAVDGVVTVADPSVEIATVRAGGQLGMAVEIASGKGSEAVRGIGDERPGWIEVGGDYGPVRQVAITVEEEGESAVLSLVVTTDGTAGPDEVTARAASILGREAEAEEPTAALCGAVVEVALNPTSAPAESAVAAPMVRADFEVREICKTTAEVEVPDLVELPRKSFEKFLQKECEAGEREVKGLEKLLREVFPVEIASGEKLEYEGYAVAEPEFCPRKCARFGRTYGGELEVRLRGSESGDAVAVKVGLFPLMTERGGFVIAGREKVVVGQLQATEGDGPNDLAFRRLLLVGEQLEAVLTGPLKEDVERGEKVEAVRDFRLCGFADAIGRFFAGGGLVRPAEEGNPLSLLSQLRAVVQQGVGRRPSFSTRDVHTSHFGRLCVLETTEGERIGINLNTALLAQVDDEGRMLTPYRRTEDGKIEYLTAEDESEKVVADLGTGDGYSKRYNGKMLGRNRGDIARIEEGSVQYVPVHTYQSLGTSASLIPFLANDDANRGLMGANMQKQAVPLVHAEPPLVRTGIEERIADDVGANVRGKVGGVVTKVEGDEVIVRESGSGEERVYYLNGFTGSSLGTCLRQRAIVREGEEVAEGQMLASGPAAADGALALGRNFLVGYMIWEGGNYEDAIVVNERLVREELLTSIKVRSFSVAISKKNAGVEKFGADHLGEFESAQLGPEGIIREGVVVEEGDVLIGKSVEKKGEKKDASLRLPIGQSGRVIEVERYSVAEGDPLDDRVGELVRVTVAVRRRLKVGDKLANRHGGKGTVGRIVPEDEMPVLPDGRTLDLVLNPLGVPSRMNIGQLLETHMGLAAHALNCSVVTPGFNGATVEDVDGMLAEAGMPQSGMFRLRDGRTGRLFDNESTVGYQYYMKLAHMVDDKLQARSAFRETGSGGGPRMGVMETWALQAHGAGHILQEMLTLKVNNEGMREQVLQALIDGSELPRPTVPETVRRLGLQLRGLCLDLKLLSGDGQEMDIWGEDALIDDAASISLEFAGADKVREWSVEQLSGNAHGSFEDLFGEEEQGIKHLELSSPMKHPWRDLLGDEGGELPEIETLPILPHSLRGDRKIDALYMDVCAVNEKGAEELQEAVDLLMGVEGLTRLLYGKKGWFAAAMAGKGGDFVGRSVIAPGYDLRFDECGLPRRMARTLFEPFVVGELTRAGDAASVDAARRMIEEEAPRAEELLEQVAAEKIVLLHRAPVLHRWGLQAFHPVLTDEEVVRLQPLTNIGFNADFDGDEMDVFLPLSAAAQEEARSMLASANQMGVATSGYAQMPSQEMIFGCYYATVKEKEGKPRKFGTLDEIGAAFERGEAGVHDPVTVPEEVGERHTTVGRALFNQLLPDGLEWIEGPVSKRTVAELLQRCWREVGEGETARLGAAIMKFGFRMATLSGLSIGKDLLPQYSRFDERLAEAWERAEELEVQTRENPPEDRDPLVDHWVQVNNDFAREALAELEGIRDGISPVYMMAFSGSRGNENQIRQLVSMRGLFAMSDGRIIDTPFATTFVRGHSPLEHFTSTCGARKGLSDSALKSANAGFLYKRIVNAVQDVMVIEEDCGTEEGVIKGALRDGQRVIQLAERILGRTALEDVVLPGGSKPIVKQGELIGAREVEEIGASDLETVAVRSPLTCKTEGGICARCYGTDPSRERLSAPGFPAGIIAAQSMGEPMTQLTFRTFYLGALARKGYGEKGKKPSTIIKGLPRLDDLFEAGQCPGQETSEERTRVEEMLKGKGMLAAADYLLAEMVGVYRLQGVLIDDRHFEVIIGQMLGKVRIAEAGDSGLEVGEIVSTARFEAANGALKGKPATGGPVVLGMTEIASLGQDFVGAAIAYDGVPALARAAARKQQVELNGVRNCTAFGKVIPARSSG